MSVATAGMLQAALLPRLPGPGSRIVFRSFQYRGHRGGAAADEDQIGMVEGLLPWGVVIRTVHGWRTCVSLADLFAGHVIVAEPGVTRRAVDRVRSLWGAATFHPPAVTGGGPGGSAAGAEQVAFRPHAS